MTNKQTQPIKDELLDSDNEGCLYESGYYWNDENHSGTIVVSQKMVDKFNLECDAEPIEQFFRENSWEDEEREDFKNYAYSIFISHCAGWTKTRAEGYSNSVDETPHGETGSEAFVMWWNDLPLELLSEPEEDVMVIGWRDG
jgi:hypothetical protein